jgi:uncharacterized protein YdbL (DUF1318 family)
MMTMFRTFVATLIAMFAAGALMTAHAQDAAIEQAKAQGLVGEMYTGYLGVVSGASVSADVKRRIDETNARRLAAYTETSQRTGEPVATIAALTAEKLIGRAGSGEAVQAGQGWTKKP